MKFWVRKTSSRDQCGFIKKIETLDELVRFLRSQGNSLILAENPYYKEKPFPNKAAWEQMKKSGRLNCKYEIEIYDDYRE